MAIRTNLIDWKVINSDTHFSKYIESVTEPWVIEWMAVTSWKVWIWKCWCPCVRTNNETVYAYVENFTEITIDTSWTWFIIVSIPQSMIDDGSLINEDWTWVATVEKVTELPEKNYLKLASINNGTITDERNIIKKVWELNMAIESLISRVDWIDERVQELEEAWAIDHLEEQALVWELYTSTSQSMFRQLTPTNANSTVEDCHVWDVAANTEIHIQRIAEWVESNQLKLKVKMAWSPTTSLKVEVRKWVQVNVSSTEAYWYWDSSQVLASWSVAYSSFSTSWSEVTVNLNNAISVDKGTLLDIVVYQESWWSKVVNASNYYILACDSTQWSEAFSFVSVNGTTRTRSKLMPYCISNSFAQSLLSKVSTATISWKSIVSHYAAMSEWNWTSAVNDSTPWRWYVYSNNNPQTAQTLSITNPLVDYRVRIANAWLLVNLNWTVVHWSTPRGWARDTWVKDWWMATNNTLTVQACDWSYWGSYFLSRVDYHTFDTISISWKTWHKLIPKEIKWLWKDLYVISFWRLPNWDWWTWN
jgi:hypothetical protein